jgi:hypothetical protein
MGEQSANSMDQISVEASILDKKFPTFVRKRKIHNLHAKESATAL